MLAEKIYTLRRKQGLSQEQLAEKIGVSRQAVSKWEGGLSTPELDKLKALSECFQITLDELTGNHAVNPSDDTMKERKEPATRKTGESKIGVCLCFTGAVCLAVFGLLTMMHPPAASRISESSMVTLDGMGILIALFVLLMVLGIVLIFRRK